jgi:hypothetical protein
MNAYPYNPNVVNPINQNNMVLNILTLLVAGEPREWNDLNGPIPSGAPIEMVVEVQFSGEYDSGYFPPENCPIADAPVFVALNSKKFVSKSSPGVTLTGVGNGNFITNAVGQFNLAFSIQGPIGGIAVFTITTGGNTGGNTYAWQLTLEAAAVV